MNQSHRIFLFRTIYQILFRFPLKMAQGLQTSNYVILQLLVEVFYPEKIKETALWL